MTMLVESYVAGRWQGPAGTRTELLNASTAEPVAVIGTDPIDMVPVLDHARSVGGPALREMPFHERALALKALAAHLNGKREQFYAISAWTGATKRDSVVDIDGGIGVLFTYASKGRRELPNSTVLVDGPVRTTRPRAGSSSASTSTPRAVVSRCRSTRSTSRSGACWRSWRRRSWPGCRPW